MGFPVAVLPVGAPVERVKRYEKGLVLKNEQPENIVVEVDLERSENVRRWWPFLRDRRIDAYEGLTKRFLD